VKNGEVVSGGKKVGRGSGELVSKEFSVGKIKTTTALLANDLRREFYANEAFLLTYEGV